VTYVLIHSPLVGPYTWEAVAREMKQRGLNVITPALFDQSDTGLPTWKQHAECVAQSLAPIPRTHSLVLVGHSGAGPILPVIRHALDHPVSAYVFIDAGLPSNKWTRLDLMKSEDPEWAREFEQALLHGQRYPTWGEADLREVIPDENARRKLAVEINPRALPFFTETIPVFDGWPDAPCAYIKFSAPYERVAQRAHQAGWLVREVSADHFHMLVNPAAVTDMIVEAVQALQQHAAG
jgi:hypothetical protein